MKSIYVSAFALFAALLVVLMLGSHTVSSLPLDDDSADAMDDKVSAYMANLLDYMSYIKHNQNSMQAKQLSRFPEVGKRERRPYRARSVRSPTIASEHDTPSNDENKGGMSLCLWKVCPAAPWLLNKK